MTMGKPKVYGLQRKGQRQQIDARYRRQQLQRQREQITKGVAAQKRAKEKAVPAYLDDRTESGLLEDD